MKSKEYPFAILIFLTVLAALPAAGEDLALDEILTRHYEAIGGLDAWSGIETMRMTGTLALTPNLDAPVTLWIARPRKYRLEFEYEQKANILTYDGEVGWSLMPSVVQVTAQRLEDAVASNLWEKADLDGLLVNHEDEGTQIVLVGASDLDGKSTYELELTLRTGAVRKVLLDAESFLINSIGGEYAGVGRIEYTFGDYRETDGVVVPFLVEEFLVGYDTRRPTQFEDVEFNSHLADALFGEPTVERHDTATAEGETEVVSEAGAASPKDPIP